MKIVIVDASETACIRTEGLLTDLNVLAQDIYCFDNAEEALEFIDDESADLVFTSLALADTDGISFTDILLRKYPKMVSRLFITSSSKESDHFQEFKEVGAKRFIHKPIKEDYFKHFISHEINKIITNETAGL